MRKNILNTLYTLSINSSLVEICPRVSLNLNVLSVLVLSISIVVVFPGFIKFKCPLCPIIHKFPLTCKSKLCPSCGFKYSSIWAQNTMKHILNIEHRNVLFTIPKECRQFFFYDRNLLSKLSATVNEIFKFCFHNISRKKLRKNKISKYSEKYFTDSDIVHYGLFQLYILLEGNLNGIRIFMPLFLWADLLKILTSRK